MSAKPEEQGKSDNVGDKQRRAERTRDLFLSVLGHDLRNPLNTIVLGCNLLTSSPLNPRQRTTVERMMSASQRAETIIRNAIFVAESLEHNVSLNRTSVDLGPICGGLLDEFRGRHTDCQLARIGDEHSVGTWDGERLAQAVDNLLSNAVKYGDGTASLEMRDASDHVVLSVHNQGHPIPSEAFGTLFDPLRRSDNRSGGVGLGLYIVDRIVSAHGGRLDFNSSESEGTTFSFWLPKNG